MAKIIVRAAMLVAGIALMIYCGHSPAIGIAGNQAASPARVSLRDCSLTEGFDGCFGGCSYRKSLHLTAFYCNCKTSLNIILFMCFGCECNLMQELAKAFK
jgi:hypothetical protein